MRLCRRLRRFAGYLFGAAGFLAALVGCIDAAPAHANSSGAASPADIAVDAATGLRSAYLFRHTRQESDARPSSMAEERARLQKHFRIVERILLGNTTRSLAIAAAQIERTANRPLSSDERVRLRRILYARRLMQIDRLAAYREAGRFPLNLVVRSAPRPIFVDEQGTPCAVGYLMLCSGAFKDVAAIVRANNFVVVADVGEGVLIDWIATSGLTQEEAALIQPVYSPPTIYEGPLSQYLLPGATLERDGLTYSNFYLEPYLQGQAGYNPDRIQVITDLSDITSTGNGMNDYRYFVPQGTNFLALSSWSNELGYTYGTGVLHWFLYFDVTVTDPAKAITEAYLSSPHVHFHTNRGNIAAQPVLIDDENLGWISTTGRYSSDSSWYSTGYAQYQLFAWTDEDSLGNVSIGDPDVNDFWNQLLSASRGMSFSPTKSMHVALWLSLAGTAQTNDIALEFKLVPVPEPTAKSLWFLGLAVLVCGYGAGAKRGWLRRR